MTEPAFDPLQHAVDGHDFDHVLEVADPSELVAVICTVCGKSWHVTDRTGVDRRVASALKELADQWQWKGWADVLLPRATKNPIDNAQRVTDWLRAHTTPPTIPTQEPPS